ncbi:uncharacterized protein C8Q71DRAFT_899293 [Rhodofomes roseus]|uniref:AB hydrolase-1 domain-containing protein n=1 Tax=Rhodofomes roseus TaxID=34475 RepID=A0ABQ8KKW7_9APHY|nr:uncharacterized protein C8Q71DRAFT_899293 [Rhodofomes roseus]KAH9838089.1 hypothetical protein C8Q71DRAFT_899293 [Rhodofomes roseus]
MTSGFRHWQAAFKEVAFFPDLSCDVHTSSFQHLSGCSGAAFTEGSSDKTLRTSQHDSRLALLIRGHLLDYRDKLRRQRLDDEFVPDLCQATLGSMGATEVTSTESGDTHSILRVTSPRHPPPALFSPTMASWEHPAAFAIMLHKAMGGSYATYATKEALVLKVNDKRFGTLNDGTSVPVVGSGYVCGLTIFELFEHLNILRPEESSLRTTETINLTTKLLGPVELGFDVWLGNNRGNKYSKKSNHHNPNSTKFWNYSIDNFAWHDIPDSIEYILDVTKEPSLSYVGFSQGTAQALAALSIHPQAAEVECQKCLGNTVDFAGDKAFGMRFSSKYPGSCIKLSRDLSGYSGAGGTAVTKAVTEGSDYTMNPVQ